MSATLLLIEAVAGGMAVYGVAAARHRQPEVRFLLRRLTRRGKVMLESILSIFRGQDQQTQTRTSASATAAPAPPPRVETSPDMPGLPENARPVVQAINALMTQIEHRIQGDPLGIPLVVEMTQMRDIHLPRLCRSYVEIPEAHRKEIYTRTGKSASFHLQQSLKAMEGRLLEIDRALAQQHISTFEANTSTINDIYRRSDGDPLA